MLKNASISIQMIISNHLHLRPFIPLCCTDFMIRLRDLFLINNLSTTNSFMTFYVTLFSLKLVKGDYRRSNPRTIRGKAQLCVLLSLSNSTTNVLGYVSFTRFPLLWLKNTSVEGFCQQQTSGEKKQLFPR